jgi:tRNA 2-thiocytidine biosynthesis protein TtcA
MKKMTNKISETKNYLNMHKRLETAIFDYDMINDGDHILAGLSGGKDSTVMLKLLSRDKVDLKARYRLSACFIKQGFVNDDKIISYLKDFCLELDVPFFVVDSNIVDSLNDSKVKPCYACSRNRRIEMFKFAAKIDANKIAFGHHRDDLIETLLMNIIFSSQIGTIAPNSKFFKGEFNLIRPMVYIHEYQIKKEVSDSSIEYFSSGCSFEGNTERDYVKKLLKDIYSHRRGAKRSIFRSLFSYVPEYLLKEPSEKNVLK